MFETIWEKFNLIFTIFLIAFPVGHYLLSYKPTLYYVVFLIFAGLWIITHILNILTKS